MPNWFTILYMVIEKILSPTFATEWTSTGYCETHDFFFWLISLVSSPPSRTTLRFPHFSLMNTNLGKPCKFSVSSISKRCSSYSAVTTFSEGLSSSMKSWFFKSKTTKLREVTQRSLINFVSYLFFSLCQKHCTKSKWNKMIA